MKFRRPHRSMAAAIASRVADGRYKFRLPEQNCPVSKASVRLDGQTSGRDPEPPGLRLADVASRKSKADWFSPKADNIGINGGDIRVLADAHEKQDPEINEDSFMPVVCNYMYNLIIKRSGNRDPQPGWVYVLWHFDGSCGFGWLVCVEPVPNHPGMKYIKFGTQVNEPVALTMSTWAEAFAVQVIWRGLSYQKQNCSRADWPPAVRGFANGLGQPLTKIAPPAGSWDFPMPLIQKVGKHIGVDADDGASVGSVLFKVSKGVTALPDDEVMSTCLNARLEAIPAEDTEVMEVLPDTDEAAACLMKDDHYLVVHTWGASLVSSVLLGLRGMGNARDRFRRCRTQVLFRLGVLADIPTCLACASLLDRRSTRTECVANVGSCRPHCAYTRRFAPDATILV